MQISEIFQSIQGEGRYSGTESIFVRTSGCNLRCWFCDTPYTSWEPDGIEQTWQDVLTEIMAYDCKHVVVTGGEPMLQTDLGLFTHALAEQGCFVTIETAGTFDGSVHADLMSISPKLGNSTPGKERAGTWTERHESTRHNKEVINRLLQDFDYQLKFVIDQPIDIDEVHDYLKGFPQVPPQNVWLMPQAVSAEELAEKSAWIEEAAQQHGYCFTSRLHIELYGNTRGK